MNETIKLEVSLTAYVRRETRTRWSAVCPMLSVASQGGTEPGAKRALQEAVELWFESCLERGVLDQALREANFRPLPSGDHAVDGAELVRVSKVKREDRDDVLGRDFSIHLSIPAYQASAFLTADQ